MKTSYLLSNTFKKIGWILFVPTALLGIYWMIYSPEPSFLDIKVFSLFDSEMFQGTQYFSIIENNIIDEIIAILLIISCLFIAFSKEKNEDEFISQIRLESLVRATILNYAILVLSIIFIYGLSFLWIFIFNMFTILLFFIIRFNWSVYKMRKALEDEK